jgi:hypothetical protein
MRKKQINDFYFFPHGIPRKTQRHYEKKQINNFNFYFFPHGIPP